jgi:HEAT repeat protein
MNRLILGIITAISLLQITVFAMEKAPEKYGAGIPDEVKNQIARLHQSSEVERAEAAMELGKMGIKAAPAIPDLIALFSDERRLAWGSENFKSNSLAMSERIAGSVASICSEAIAKINDAAAVPLLLDVLDTKQWEHALSVLKLMGKNAAAAVPRLMAGLNVITLSGGENPKDLIGVDPKSLKEYQNLHGLKHRADPKKMEMAKTLFMVNKESLFEVLKSGQKPAADYAALILAKAGEKAAFPQVLAAVKDDDLKEEALYALGDLKDERAVIPLLEYLLHSTIAVEKMGLVRTLGEIGDPRAVPQLTICLKDRDSFIRENAIEALGKIKNSKALEALLALLSNASSEDTFYILKALDEQKNKLATIPLLELLNKNGISREGLIKVLKNINDISSVETLISVLQSKDQIKRRAALEILQSITHKNFDDDPLRWQKWWDSTGKTGTPPRSEKMWHLIRINIGYLLLIVVILVIVIAKVKNRSGA